MLKPFILLCIFCSIAAGPRYLPRRRYRSPHVERFFYNLCLRDGPRSRCPRGQACEERTICPFAGECQELPVCLNVAIGRGQCPHPSLIGRRRRPECNTDSGCYSNPRQICCHGYYSSECRTI